MRYDPYMSRPMYGSLGAKRLTQIKSCDEPDIINQYYVGGEIEDGNHYFKRDQTEYWTTVEQEAGSNQ